MDEPAQTIPAQNRRLRGCRCRLALWVRWRETQRSMWPVPVVMVHEHTEDPLEVLLVQNQQPVETL